MKQEGGGGKTLTCSVSVGRLPTDTLLSLRRRIVCPHRISIIHIIYLTRYDSMESVVYGVQYTSMCLPPHEQLLGDVPQPRI